jgi:MFS family permease
MRRPLVVVAGAFVCFGVYWGSWAVATADVEKYTGLSNAGLGLLLSGSVGAGGIAAAAAGGAMSRSGPDRLLSIFLIPWGIFSIAASLVPGKAAFLASFALAVSSAGLVDMAMNSAATVGLGGSAGAMVRFHALFNAGTLCGAGLVAGLVSGSVSWRWTWLFTGSAAIALAIAARTNGHGIRPQLKISLQDQKVSLDRTALVDPPIAPTKGSASFGSSLRAIRAEGLVTLAVTFAITAMVEGGIDTWGVLYLRTRLATTVLLGAGAYAAGQLIAAVTRTSGAPLMTILGHRRGLVLGAAIAALGLILEAFSVNAAVAGCGLALAAGGISLCWPLTMARLAPQPDSSEPGRSAERDGSTAVLVGAFTAAGYLGWVIGPAIVGTMSDHVGLRAGLLLLAGLAASASATLAVARQRTAAR